MTYKYQQPKGLKTEIPTDDIMLHKLLVLPLLLRAVLSTESLGTAKIHPQL